MPDPSEKLPPKAKLLLIALAAPQEQSTPNGKDVNNDELAILIGVEENPDTNIQNNQLKWDESVWRVGITTLTDLKKFFEGANEGGDKGWMNQTIFQAFSQVTSLTQDWAERKEIDEIGTSDGKGGETENRFQTIRGDEGQPTSNRLWIDHIYRIYMFRGESDSEESIVWYGCGSNRLSPLLRLDTAAWVVNGNQITREKIVPRKWVVSRIRLDSEESWLNDPVPNRGDKKAREITGYRLVAHIPVPINSHLPDKEEDGSDKLFDTRAILIAAAEKAQTTLWDFSEENTRPHLPHFTQLRLAFSESNGFSGDGLQETTLQKANVPSPRSLADLLTRPQSPADAPAPVFQNGDNAVLDSVRADIPILANIPGFTNSQPTVLMKDNLWLRRRELGFRIIQDSPKLKVALRVDVKLRIGTHNDWAKLWSRVVIPVIPLECPKDGFLVEPEANGFHLSQEQRREDITVDLVTPPTAHTVWLLTARVNSLQDKAPIEKLILDRVGLMAADVLAGVGDVRSISGLSMLPVVEAVDNQAGLPWHLVGLVRVPTYRRRILLDILLKDITWSMAKDPGLEVEFRSLQPVPQNNPWSLANRFISRSIKLRKDRGWLLDIYGDPIWREQTVVANDDPKMTISTVDMLDNASSDPRFHQPSLGETGSVVFKISQAGDDGMKRIGADRSFQLGSIQFRTDKDNPDLRFYMKLFPAPDRRGQESRGLGIQPIQDRLECIAELLLSSFRPTSQDPLSEPAGSVDVYGGTSRVDRGLILELPLPPLKEGTLPQPSEEKINPPLKLRLEEHVGGKEDQSLKAKLVKQPSEEDTIVLNPLLVIDPEPFRVVLVQGTRIRSDESGNILAVFQPADDGRFSWKIIDPRQAYRLRLPPQCLGEAMERTRTRPEAPDDINPGEPVQVRFGSATEMVLDPTFRDQSTGEAGWNLRRLLNRITDGPPGVLLRDLRLELAYGLVTRLTINSDQLIWIAEMSGVIGRTVPPLKKQKDSPSSSIRDYISKVLELESSRLAVDKLWSVRPELPFRTDHGLSFRLKTNEDSEAAENKDHQKLRYPAPYSEYPNTDDSRKEAQRVLSTFSKEAVSFPGGIAWAVESGNVLLELFRQLQSSVGRIGDIHLSALGGWGTQRAEFDKSVFETDTSMGRLHTYRLERIGRIGALHNRAKHVVIYRRTVAPSDQFEGVQDLLLGQPVLRKSEEYIEIIEPEHRYTSGSPTLESGCLIGARFLTTRILVDGAWGQDVRDEGWKLPLWRQGLQPDEYPPPQVELIMVGEDGKERGVGIQSVEKLVFYTSTTPNETAASISTWHPVEGIDYCDLPAPQVKQSPSDSLEDLRKTDLHDGFLPGPAAVPFGYDSLTLHLLDNSIPIQISAGRTQSGPCAPLRTVTLSRASPVPLPQGATFLGYGAGATQIATDVRGAYDRIFGRLMGKAEELRQQNLLSKDTIKTILNDYLSEAKVEDEKRRLDIQIVEFGALRPNVGEKLNNAVNQVKSRIEKLVIAEARWMFMHGHTIAIQKLIKWQQYLLVSHEKLLNLQNILPVLIEGLREVSVVTIVGLQEQLIQLRNECVDILFTNIATMKSELDLVSKNKNDFFEPRVKPRTAQIDMQLVVLPYVATFIASSFPSDIRKSVLDEIKNLVIDSTSTIKDELSPPSPDSPPAKRFYELYEAQVSDYTSFKQGIADLISVLNGSGNELLANPAPLEGLLLELNRIQESNEINAFLAAVDVDTAVRSNAEIAAGQFAELLEGISMSYTTLLESGIDSLSSSNEKLNKIVSEFAINASGEQTIFNSKVKETTSSSDKLVESWSAKRPGSVLQDGLILEDVLGKSLDIPIWSGQIKDNINDFIENLDPSSQAPGELLKEIEQLVQEKVNDVDISIGSELGSLQRTVADLDQPISAYRSVYQNGDNVLRILRAVGDPPKAEGLVINRPEVAYVFDLAKSVVDISPCLALANRGVATARTIEQAADAASNLLQPFGVRLPIQGLAEEFVPDILRDITLAKLIPDMAGLKFDALLPSLKLPDLGDKVNLTRGFDKVKREAWLKAIIDIPLEATTSLLTIGPLKLLLEKGRITARSQITLQANGSSQSESRGEITGNWRLITGEIEVITFVQTPLVFDQAGKLDFKLSSSRILLSPQLKFITTLLESIGKSVPPGVEPVLRGGIPAGVLCRLSMALPPINSGAFGITDLTLGTSFGIFAYPEFEISTSLNIGSRQSPFTLSVWLLNGGGYISMSLRYLPTQSPALVVYTLDIAIVAGVGIGFAFGVISGGVWLQVGCSVAMAWSTGSSDKVTTITVFILARGSVDVAGLVTAGINLIMQASYDGNDMVASGSLRMSFRISYFYTLKVNQTVKYRLKGDRKPATPSANEYAESYG